MSEVADDGEVDGRTFFVYDGDTADEEYLVGALEILPAAAGEAAEVFEVVFVCSLEGRTLVATPQAAWHRRAAQRRLPPGALVRATAVEVAPESRTSRAELAPDARIKVWLGFLEPGLSEATRFDMLVHSRGRRRWIPTSWRGFGRGGEGQVPVRDCGERRAITARSPVCLGGGGQPGCPPWRCQTCSPRTRPGA